MPAIAALTINDGQTSPAAHTFSPVTTDGQTARWADRSPSIPAGFRTISFEMAPPSGTRTVNRATAGFTNPTVGTVDGADKVTRYSSAQVVLNIHPESTLQERKDLLAYVKNFLADSSVATAIQNVEPYY